MLDVTENFVTERLLKVQTFFESICGKTFSWKVLYGLIVLMKCSVSTQKNLVSDVRAADVRYHLDCW